MAIINNEVEIAIEGLERSDRRRHAHRRLIWDWFVQVGFINHDNARLCEKLSNDAFAKIATDLVSKGIQ